jgi:multicomponent Na+:H+ antiporter subunit D
VFGFARAVGYVIGPEELAALGAAVVLSALAAITIVVASAMATVQDNLKRRLAYSTVAQLSYIILGLSLANATGWTGGLYHLANHAALKITLFFCAGALYVHAHLDRVSQLDGVGRRMPLTMGAFALASVGLVGLPPMGGFVSKWHLLLGASEADQPVLVGVLLLSGVLTAAYLFPIVVKAFWRPAIGVTPHSPVRLNTEASPLLVGPLLATALIGLALGLGDLFSIFAVSADDARAVLGGAP